jgi:tetratricopeptide (TPR) repeat protein
VSDDIRSLTKRLAEEPSSLACLELGEALRRRGQLEAAGKVVRGGLNRYPGLADAHDLLGRILGDQGDLAGAFDAWADALRLDPMRTGALKGIAFLYFRAGDVEAALEHLQAPRMIRRSVDSAGDRAGPPRRATRRRRLRRSRSLDARAGGRRAGSQAATAEAPAAPAAHAAPADRPFAGVATTSDCCWDANGQRLAAG